MVVNFEYEAPDVDFNRFIPCKNTRQPYKLSRPLSLHMFFCFFGCRTRSTTARMSTQSFFHSVMPEKKNFGHHRCSLKRDRQLSTPLSRYAPQQYHPSKIFVSTSRAMALRICSRAPRRTRTSPGSRTVSLGGLDFVTPFRVNAITEAPVRP